MNQIFRIKSINGVFAALIALGLLAILTAHLLDRDYHNIWLTIAPFALLYFTITAIVIWSHRGKE